MSKVTVVGAGAVGATCANVMACREVASEVVLIDIKEGLSEGKMLDMYQTSTLMDFRHEVSRAPPTTTRKARIGRGGHHFGHSPQAGHDARGA